MKKHRILTDPEIAYLVDSLGTLRNQFTVANAQQRGKVLLAAKFADKRLTTRANEDGTYTVLALP